MDQFDQATELEMAATESAIAAQRARAATQNALKPAGFCQNPNCGEDFPPGSIKLFCGAECAAEHQRIAGRR